MGVKIFDLVESEETTLDNLKGKILAIDTSLFLYQFLSSIRQRDGNLFTDSKGRVTSHLIGLFSRTSKLLQHGILPVFVFDGKHPELKHKEQKKRAEAKMIAQKKYEAAAEKEELEEMKKYAARTSRLTKDMIEDSKKLIDYLGCPIVQAPSEAEAQAAYMNSKGDVYAVASQDADTLLFGAKRLLRNLAISGKKKRAGKLAYTTVKPEIITVATVLNTLGIDKEQLIILSMLVGTDFNPGGIKGIGPKKALKIVKENNHDYEKIFDEVKWNDHIDVEWKEIFDVIHKMPVTDDYELKWYVPDKAKIIKFLVTSRGFNKERVENSIEAILQTTEQKKQKGLGEFF